jgi:uncharacterized protein (UPF0332 family)
MYNGNMKLQHEEIALYIQNAHEMLEASHVLLNNDFYTSAINSQIYGWLMEDRHESDYELGASVTDDDAKSNLADAEQFVLEVQRWLKQENWI